MRIRYSKLGGLRFLRIGRLQLSWCFVKPRRIAPSPVFSEITFTGSLTD